MIDKAISSDQGIKFVYIVDKDNKVQYRRVTTTFLEDDGLRVVTQGSSRTNWLSSPGLQAAASPHDHPTGTRSHAIAAAGMRRADGVVATLAHSITGCSTGAHPVASHATGCDQGALRASQFESTVSALASPGPSNRPSHRLLRINPNA